MPKKMLIDATHTEETRVVVMDGNKVDEFDFESINKRQLAGNIYLAKVTRVEPSLQAAFVEYGGNRHGFLAFSEVHPDYYQIPVADREALKADEEKAEAEDEDAAEAKEAKPKKTRSRRSRSSRSKKDAAQNAEDANVAEDGAGNTAEAPTTPDAQATDTAAPMAETAADAVTEEAAPTEAASDSAPSAEGQAEADTQNADAGTPESDSDNPENDASDSPPKSIAESTGADEGESVSEDLTEAAAPEAATIADDTSTDEAAEDAPKKTTRTRSSRTPSKSRSKKSDSSDRNDADDSDRPDQPEDVGGDQVEDEVRPRRTPMRRYKIQEVIKVRQILLVQVVKEERGNKGAALTTYLSLAGRYCVLMPNTARGGGISRKITQAADRKKLKEIAGEMEVPKGMGLIIRTAGSNRTKTEIKRDYEFLLRQWDQIRELTLRSAAPTLVYEEGSLIKRSIRDLYGRDIDAILVEGDEAYREAKDYMKMLMPSHAKNVQPYRETTPLFAKYGAESHLAAMFNPTVQLKSGGYIVIGVTEALVAIDVNSGRSTREHSIEETALKTNLEAADEVARQLRLRDLAGLIVIDFIDMDENRNNRAVEKRMKDRLKDDRARIQVGRISAFGLMEMSRQRLRPGMIEATTAPCTHCHGTGIVRSADNVALAILREIEEEGVRRRSAEVKIAAPVAIANYIMNAKRAHLAGIEERYQIAVTVEGDATLVSPDYKIEKIKGTSRPAPQRRDDAPRAVSAESAFFEPEETPSEEPAEAPKKPQGQQHQNAPRDEGDEEGKSKRRRRGKRGGRKRKKNDGGPLDVDGDSETDDDGDGNRTVQSSPLGDVIDTTGEADDLIVETREESAQNPKRDRPQRKPFDEVSEGAAKPAEAKAETAKPAPKAAPEPEDAPNVAESAAPEPAPEPTDAAAGEAAPEAEPVATKPAPKARASRAKAKPAAEKKAAAPKAAAKAPAKTASRTKAAAKPKAEPEEPPASETKAAPDTAADTPATEPEKPKKAARVGWWS